MCRLVGEELSVVVVLEPLLDLNFGAGSRAVMTRAGVRLQRIPAV